MPTTIAKQLIELKKNIVLVYAFNGTGKTRLSVAYKDATKARNKGKHSGVYYNAYSEDLFTWDNDDENDGANMKLLIKNSSLNQYHALLDEDKLREKLAPYKPKYKFYFNEVVIKRADGSFESKPELGYDSVSFFLTDDKTDTPIKISRGEEQIFIWCFFLALFDVEGWTGDGKQSSHFFIDDPVSSLDDHNIFVTVSSLMDLIERHYKTRKILITTHHIGFFSILHDWLVKGEKASSFKNDIQTYILKKDGTDVNLINPKNDVFLYHLELLQTLKKAKDEDEIYAFHFALLRQVLENISSFLGVGRFAYVLEQIGITDVDDVARIVNTLSHKTVFRYEAKELVPDNKAMFIDVFEKIMAKYKFVLHA